MPAQRSVPTIVVTGPVGVGKSTAIEEMSGLLRAADIAHATVDVDQLRACYPRPRGDDRWGTKLGLANLAALWRNYRRAGARRLVIACVIEARSELAGYRRAVPGAEITVVRLRASPRTLQNRVRARGQGAGLAWHLARAVELAKLMDEWKVEDLLINTERKGAVALAREILRRTGWLGPRK